MNEKQARGVVAKMGRPTKYTPDLESIAEAYIDGGYLDMDQVIPSHTGMANALGVAPRTLYRWAADGMGEFCQTLERCMAKQEVILVNKGLTSEFNSNIVKLALSNHGYSEKTAADINLNTPIKTITRTIIDASHDQDTDVAGIT